MAMLTVRNLDEAIKSRLRIKAAQHGCSMEEETRRILREVLLPGSHQRGLGTRLHHQVVELSGGGELELPARSLPRSAPFVEDD